MDDRSRTRIAWNRTPPADGHRVEPDGDGGCRVVLELPVRIPWYVPLCAVTLGNLARIVER